MHQKFGPGFQFRVAMSQSLSADEFVALPLEDMKAYLSTAGSQELRDIRAYIGLGTAGTKEENRALIADHFARARSLRAGVLPPDGPITRSIATRTVPPRVRAL